MSVMDEFKKQREAIKDKPLKEKLGYYWYYYKMHVIVAICVIILVVTTIHDITTKKDVAFYVAFLNAYDASPLDNDYDEQFIDEFASLTDINLDEYEVYLDTNMYFNVAAYDQASMAAMQKFLALSSAGEIDVVVTDRDIFSSYAGNGFFRDISTYLSEEQLEKYSEHFYYFDEAMLDKEIDYEEVYTSEFVIPADTVERRNPESMEKPVPVGIFLDDSMKSKLTQAGYYTDEQEIIFGFMGSNDNSEYCRQFLEWLAD